MLACWCVSRFSRTQRLAHRWQKLENELAPAFGAKEKNEKMLVPLTGCSRRIHGGRARKAGIELCLLCLQHSCRSGGGTHPPFCLHFKNNTSKPSKQRLLHQLFPNFKTPPNHKTYDVLDEPILETRRNDLTCTEPRTSVSTPLEILCECVCTVPAMVQKVPRTGAHLTMKRIHAPSICSVSRAVFVSHVLPYLSLHNLARLATVSNWWNQVSFLLRKGFCGVSVGCRGAAGGHKDLCAHTQGVFLQIHSYFCCMSHFSNWRKYCRRRFTPCCAERSIIFTQNAS